VLKLAKIYIARNEAELSLHRPIEADLPKNDITAAPTSGQEMVTHWSKSSSLLFGDYFGMVVCALSKELICVIISIELCASFNYSCYIEVVLVDYIAMNQTDRTGIKAWTITSCGTDINLM
jgi:hypothetical protein